MQAVIRGSALGGRFCAIPSKSDAHRLLIAASLAASPTQVLLSGRSADITATVSCLRELDTTVLDTPEGLDIFPQQGKKRAPALDCGESGTTLRLLIPVAAARYDTVHITGRGRLPERPVEELLRCLRVNGTAADSAHLPLTLAGRLRAGVFEIDGNVSSQYISGLLLALPLLYGDSEIRLLSPLESSGYVELTRAALTKFRIEAHPRPSGFYVPGGQTYRSPGSVAVEGDWSNAAFFLAAGALHGLVACTGLSVTTHQPDFAILELLQRFGANVEVIDGAVLVSPGELRGIVADVSEKPDLVPILAALGACARGQTHLANAKRLRLKESDRLAATTRMLRALGVRIKELEDALIITGDGEKLKGAKVDCCNDHRIAMAAAIAASRAEGETTLCGAECVQKSYPSFFEEFARLGGNVHVV
ncbi:MAG TPA: 3-phosphoshikimate 1-carboxyvinyltransferase [Feifaniaceae bacterium]|nr:3-phosphoshikimate 1-carboxyvinyltransferase [Feifaniaceae bacterium]